MADITLTLADPTTRTDGTPEAATDLASLNIYRADGSAAPVLVGTADPSASPPTFVDKGRPPGTYGYSATAVDKLGRESAHSDVFPVVVAAPPAVSSAPVIVSATQA
jgi:hypothetical protein